MKSIRSPLPLPLDHVECETKSNDLQVNQGIAPIPINERFNQPGSLFLVPESFQSTAVQRFVILVPSESFSTPDLSFKINRYTIPGTSLLFVARVIDSNEEFSVRRELVLLESMARSPRLQVQSRIVSRGSWMDVVKEVWRKGDLIICLEDHKVQQFLVWPISLGRKIFSELHIPVLIHQDIHVWGLSAFQKAVRVITAWFLFLGTILGFALLQIQIDRSIDGWMGRVFLCLTLIIEFYLIWKINDIFSNP